MDMWERITMKSKTNIIRYVILVVAIAVFLFSAYKLYTIFSEYMRGNKEYKKIVEDVIIKEKVEITEGGVTHEVEVFKVDFEKLSKANSETVGWIRFEEPEKINYPLVQAGDNDKYLHTTFEGKRNSVGTIFMDAGQAKDFSDSNTFIYGHNMKDGSMFAGLQKYKEQKFAKEYPFFYIYTPDGKELKYQVFAVGIVEDNSDSYQKYYKDENEYLSYLQHIKNTALYETGVEVNATSQVVSLSTCTNVSDTQRLVVHGVKIGEKVIGE